MCQQPPIETEWLETEWVDAFLDTSFPEMKGSSSVVKMLPTKCAERQIMEVLNLGLVGTDEIAARLAAIDRRIRGPLLPQAGTTH